MFIITFQKNNNNYFRFIKKLPPKYAGYPLRYDFDFENKKKICDYFRQHFPISGKFTFQTKLGSAEIRSVLKIVLKEHFNLENTLKQKEFTRIYSDKLNEIEQLAGLCGFTRN